MMYKIITITEDSDDTLLTDLVVLGKALDQQEIMMSKQSGIHALNGYTGWLDNPSKILTNHQVYGATVDGKLVGFITGVKEKGYETELGAIDLIYVDPAYQRMGIGTGLWKTMLDYFGAVDYVTLAVYSGNTGAIKFYESIGLKPYLYNMGFVPNA